jgi:hypothetical protein
MTNRLTLATLLILVTIASAQTANKLGLMPQGTLVPGHMLIVGTTANDAADGGPPGQALSIGQTVTGAVVNSCLTVDAAGKLAQTDCALAH